MGHFGHGGVLEFLKSDRFFCSVGDLKKVAQNVLKHALVLEFLRSDFFL